MSKYRLSRRKQIVENQFDVSGEEDLTPPYNIAPTQPVPVICRHPEEDRRVSTLMLWGLIPSWAKDTSAAAGMINARSETAATKRAFRDPLRFRRCLVPRRLLRMAAQRNWQAARCFEVNDRELFAFAGLWNGWRDATGSGSDRAQFSPVH